MALSAELRRRNAAAALVDWILVGDVDNTETGLSDPVIDYGVRTLLTSILDALDTLVADQDAATETTVATLATQATLAALHADVGDTADAEAAGDGTVIAILKRLRTLLGNIDGTDFATEATLDAVGVVLTSIDTRLAVLEAVDYATGAHQLTNHTRLQEIEDRIANLEAIDFATETTLDAIATDVGELAGATLAARLLNKRPQAGYNLWLDTADASYIFMAEAPIASLASAADFDVIRLPLDADGNIVGEVESVTGIAWDDRASAGGWA